MERRSPRSSASSSRCCRRRSASASTGISAPPTPSIRTSTRSRARTRSTSSCCPATTSTRWTTRRCCARTASAAPRRPSRASKSRVEEAIALRHHPDRSDRPRHRLPGEAEAIPRPFPAPTDVALGVDGHLHLRSRLPVSRARSGRGARDQSRLRQGHPAGDDQGRAGRSPTASTTRTRRPRNTGATSARSTPTTRPTWTSCHVNPEFNLYDPEWPMRTQQPQAPPAKFVFADEGQRCGQAPDSIISSGCIISGAADQRQRALPERPRAQLLRRSKTRS